MWHPRNAQGGPVTEKLKHIYDRILSNLVEVLPYMETTATYRIFQPILAKVITIEPKWEAHVFDPGTSLAYNALTFAP
jgi:hypothetical protein